MFGVDLEQSGRRRDQDIAFLDIDLRDDLLHERDQDFLPVGRLDDEQVLYGHRVQAGDLAHDLGAHAGLEANELVFVPALVVVLVEFLCLDEQLGPAEGLGLVAGFDLLEGEQQDVLVPAGTVHRQGARRRRLHHEFGSRDKAVFGGIGEYLDGHLAADSVGLADSCHLKLHVILCSGCVSESCAAP